MYEQSSIYFVIKNLSGLFYIIPFYPIILAIGKTSAYANVHMIMAIIIVIAEYIVCKTCNSAVYVAIASELCQLFKIWLMMQIIAGYAHKKITDLIPPKSIGLLLFIAILASLPPFFVLSILEMKKWHALFLSLGFFLVDYYVLCWIFKVTYRDIIGGFMTEEAIHKIVKLIP